MSATIKFTISDDNYKDLCSRAAQAKLTIQDYIRKELFGSNVPFTPYDAIKRALANYSKGETFTVPELFGEDWNLPNGIAGQFGKDFCKLVEDHYSSQILFTRNYNSKKHAVYQII